MAKLVTIPEAAEALGCSRQNIYQTIERYNIPTPKKAVIKRSVVERTVRIKHVDLDMLRKVKSDE